MTVRPERDDASTVAPIDPRLLRRAIEFAVIVAREMVRRRSPIAPPPEVLAVGEGARIPTRSLGRLRRAIEGDPTFRRAIAAGAAAGTADTVEAVDDIGRLWLSGEPGWERRVAAIVDEQDREQAARRRTDAERQADKRRRSAERAAERARSDLERTRDELAASRATVRDRDRQLAAASSELDALRAEHDALRAELDALRAEHDALRAEHDALRAEGRGRRTEGEDQRTDRRTAVARAEVVTAATITSRSGGGDPARRGVEAAGGSAPRVALRLPGGVSTSSPRAVEALVRAGARFVVDGYNVAMKGWPLLSIERQRDAVSDRLDDFAVRNGADVTVVFDGAAVVGAHARVRRTTRIEFSPPGVSADDVIRDIVRRRCPSGPICVVTDDRAIVRDVKRAGANVVTTDALLRAL